MIRVQREDFDPAKEVVALVAGRPDIGAVVTFTGLVRAADDADAGAISAMTLEHYPAMTEAKLAEIEAEAHRRWTLSATLIVHRYGRMTPGERIVLVIAASPHRTEAFAACEFLVDWLKTKAPFWKLEETESGPRWVEGRESDDAAAARWSGENVQATEAEAETAAGA